MLVHQDIHVHVIASYITLLYMHVHVHAQQPTTFTPPASVISSLHVTQLHDKYLTIGRRKGILVVPSTFIPQLLDYSV